MSSKPNILFIVVDSLRADKCFGKKKTSKTPNIDRLIENGTYFSNTISSADGTTLSLGSFFTALYPFKTGLGGDSFSKWGNSFQNYISILKNNGYETIATVPKSISSFGIISNFDDSDVYDTFYRLKDGLGEKIVSKLDLIQTKEPWFYYIHLMDLHQPVQVPDNMNKEDFGESQYERMVSSIDLWLGKFFEQINLEKTLVVLTSDHGEYIPFLKKNNKTITFEEISLHRTQGNLGKLFPKPLQSLKLKLAIRAQNIRKNQRLKKIKKFDLSPFEKRLLINSRADPICFLYDELILIPLIFCGNKIKHSVITQQVRSIDVFPTVADISNLKIETSNIHDGQSLLPLIEGEKIEELPCYLESSALIKKSEGDVIGIRTSNYKYFRSVNDPNKRIHLFNLIEDPHEEHNLANENIGLVKEMEKTILDIKNDSKNITETEEISDNETKQIEDELRKLGYI